MSGDPYQPIPLFAFPLFSTRFAGHEAHRQGLLDAVAGARRDDPGVGRSNRSGWHSGPAFLKLRDEHVLWVLQRAAAFATQALAPLYGGWAKKELRLGDYWANVLPPGAWNAPHHHHPQHWSGVYYVSVPDAGTTADDPRGMIEFLNPWPTQSQWGAGSHAHAPCEGTNLLFPSSLVHLVHPHSGNADRVSVAYNLDVVIQ